MTKKSESFYSKIISILTILSDQNKTQSAKYFSTLILYTTDTGLDSLKTSSKQEVQKKVEFFENKIAEAVTRLYHGRI